ncbi:MAG TPA: AI-2E family transporter [Rhodanobacteraceae bacterium]|nr:AI-2E family transporter [Rhodanobacteraceae bacterium]
MKWTATLRWQLLALCLLIGLALWALSPVLAPFVAAAVLAYLGDPLADRLERLHMGRTLAVTIVFVVMIALLVGAVVLLVPLVERQITHLVQSLPRYAAWFRTDAGPWLQQHLKLDPETFDPSRLLTLLKEHIGSAGGLAAAVVARVSRSGLALVGWLVNIVLVPVVAFYLLRDWDTLVERIHRLVPRGLEPTVSRLAHESNAVLGAFVRGQLLVMLALGLIYGIGLWLVGIDVGPLIGMVAGLVSFVPYLGFIIGLIASLIAALVQYHDWLHIGLVLVVFAIGQAMEGYVLTPRLVGGKIGLHPVAVIFAVLAGGALFGFVGILLALPAASVIMVLLRYGHERYTASELYRGNGDGVVVASAPHAPVTPAPPAEPPPSTAGAETERGGDIADR